MIGKIKILFCLLFVLTISRSVFAINVPTNGEQKIDKEFLALNTSAANLQFREAQEKLDADSFKVIDETTFNDSIKVYWISFPLTNTIDDDIVAVLNFNDWAYVNAYEILGSQHSLHKTGHLLPFNSRDIKIANKCFVEIKLKPNQSKMMLVRLESKFNNDKVPQDLSFKISTDQFIYERSELIGKIIFSFLAILLVVFLNNLFIYISTRLEEYFYYLLVIALTLYATANNSGYIIEIFSWVENFPKYLMYIETIGSTLLGIAIILFVQSFFKVRERYPFWSKFLTVLMWLLIPLAVITFINFDVGVNLSGLIGLISVVVILTIAIKSVRDKFPSALYFFLGYFAFFTSLLVIIFSVAGILPDNLYLYELAMPIGTTIEAVLFSIALANMINVLRDENLSKQKLLINQLEENKQLQTKVNRELEQKVSERTAKIEEQKEILNLEKQKTDELLLNILPESTANELKTRGKSDPQSFEEVTVIFTDFVGFTLISEKLSAEELVQEIDYCFKAFDDIANKFGLEKIKTIGDSYMAICGAPDIRKDHAMQSVLAAKEFLSFVDKWNENKRKSGVDEWNIRIGLHCGPVVAGVVGKKKFTFDIWGDTVNIASRIESNSEPGKINISEAIYEKIKHKFDCTPRGTVVFKHGLQADMYFLN